MIWARLVTQSVTARAEITRTMAEADGNRTRQRQRLPLSDFEDRADHQIGYASSGHGFIMAGTMKTMLTSVGHGALDRVELVALLRSAGIAALVDIRRFPNSRRNPDVETSAMAAWARDAGLAYRWDERLGGRRRLPAGTETVDGWWRVAQFAAYAAYTRTAPFGEALSELVEQAQQQKTAMMCSESVWWRCHRRIVADVAVLEFGIEVGHLMHDGRVVHHTPSEGAVIRPDGKVGWPAPG